MDDKKFMDVATPKATATSRPIIVKDVSAEDTTIKPVPVPTQTAEPKLDSAMTEALNTIDISEDGKLTNIEPAKPAESNTPAPGAPEPQKSAVPAGAAADNIPKFGALQQKVESHPLFSGKSEPAPKKPRSKIIKKTFIPLTALLIAVAGLYLAVDAGAIRGASHLPFHIFKQPIAVKTPVITTPTATAQTKSSTTPAATTQTDPYAGWKTYSSTKWKYSFKYPSTWVQAANATACSDNLLLLGPDAKSVGKCATEGFGEISASVVIGDQRSKYILNTGYTGIVKSDITVDGVIGNKQTATAKGQQSSGGPGGLPDGTSVIQYTFFANNQTYIFLYNQTSSYPDASADFNSAVTQTLKFTSS